MTNREAIEYFKNKLDITSALQRGQTDKNAQAITRQHIAAYELAIKALETQEPIQIRKFGDGSSKCPICRNWLKEGMDFCDKCGQAIDWRTDDEPYR